MKCPKCGSEARDIARFCRRCHATLRYQCPACRHEQRQGGICENCGIDFLKYVSAVVAEKQTATDAVDDRLQRRSTLLKNVLWVPLTAGISLLLGFFAASGDRRGPR
jgi:hypothetical protein